MTDQNDNRPASDEASERDRKQREADAEQQPSREDASDKENQRERTAPESSASGGEAAAESESEQKTTETETLETTGGGGSPPRGPGRQSIERRARFWVWPVLCLMLFVVFAAAGYWAYDQYQRVASEWQTVANQQSELREQHSAMRNKVDSLESRLNQAEQARQSLARELRNELQELENMLVDTAQRLTRRQQLEGDRWKLEEALTLLRLAERRLQLDQNAEVAIRLLKSADQILAGLDQASVLPVRRQIARDLMALKSVDTPDITGLYFRIDALGQELAAKEWTPQQRVKPEAQQEPKSPWEAFQENLSSLVTITRLETPYQAPPLLSDFAQWRQHARLLVEQLQMALLARNQALFDAALDQLINHVSLMRQHLKLDAIVEELRSLRGIQLDPNLPDIHGSTAALEEYLSRIESQSEEGDGSKGDAEGANESSASDAAS